MYNSSVYKKYITVYNSSNVSVVKVITRIPPVEESDALLAGVPSRKGEFNTANWIGCQEICTDVEVCTFFCSESICEPTDSGILLLVFYTQILRRLAQEGSTVLPVRTEYREVPFSNPRVRCATMS
jgi:hypothetical protein